MTAFFLAEDGYCRRNTKRSQASGASRFCPFGRLAIPPADRSMPPHLSRRSPVGIETGYERQAATTSPGAERAKHNLESRILPP